MSSTLKPILSPVTTLFDAITPKAPKIPPVTPMPDTNDQLGRQRQKQKIANAAQAQTGRQSTILSDTLG